MKFYRGSTSLLGAVANPFNLITVFFLLSSLLGVVCASPFPQTSLNTQSTKYGNGQYTPELYPGQKGFYEPNQADKSVPELLIPSADNSNYRTSQSPQFAGTTVDGIEDSAQPVQPGQKTTSEDDILASNSINNIGDTQQSQEPYSQVGGAGDTNLNAPTSNPGANSVGSANINKYNPSTYRQYSGDGSISAGWPDQTQWASFEDLFDINRDAMAQSCAYWDVPLNTESEIQEMKQSIKDIAVRTQVDNRFILAIIMQESKGCVRVPTTSYGVRNPGLMQSHDGAGTCNEGGKVQTPCSRLLITQMINDGTAGTSSGPGLLQIINGISGNDASIFYKASRIWNSGSIASSGDLGDGIAVHCYASDIANRLTGWADSAESPGSSCSLDSWSR